MSLGLRWRGSGKPPKHLYRYLSWRNLERMFTAQGLAVSSPYTWDDPTEYLWTNWVSRHVPTKVYCCCWSPVKRSFAQWLVNSTSSTCAFPDTTVRIRTTFKRMRKALRSTTIVGASHAPDSASLAKVRYLRDNQVEDRHRSLHESGDPSLNAANALSYKRYPYRYEREVRLIVTIQAFSGTDRAFFSCDLNLLLEQVMIDPRAQPSDVRAITERLSALQFKGIVRASRLLALPSALRPFAVKPESC